LIFISSSIGSLYILSADVNEVTEISPLTRFILGTWFAQLWFRLLNSMHVLEAVGPRFLPIFRTIKDTGGFFFVVLFTFAGSVHGYYALGARDSPGPVYAAVAPIFRLYFLGDFDLQELEGVDPTFEKASGVNGEFILKPVDPDPSPMYVYIHALFYTISVFFSVVLMNLFIGILGASYDIQEDIAAEVFLQSRAIAVTKYRQLPWVMLGRRAYRYCFAPDLQAHLFALVRCSSSDETTRSLRAYINEKMKRKIEETNKKIEETNNKMDEKFNELLMRIDAGFQSLRREQS
jgi:hypothetical protein